MPLKYFNCPDEETRPISDCLEKCPRTEGRCLSLPTLYSIGKAREWTGKPSTTQLLNPTRMEYLKIIRDYTIDPFRMAFALLGTRHHGKLEQVAKQIESLIAEQKITDEVSGVVDLLEPINGGNYRLIDYKTYGSFAVRKHISDEPANAYDRKMLSLQMNNYRLLCQGIGFNITELKCQITVRDGNTQSAYKNGIPFNLILLDVPIMDDDDVVDYFMAKSKALTTAIANNQPPELCPYQERWNGRRCKGFCDVARFCPEGAKVNKVEFEI